MTDIKDLYLLKILHIAAYNLSIESLINLGLDYSQVAEILNYIIQEKMVNISADEGIKLTEKGNTELDRLNQKLYPLNTKKWILPEEESRGEKIGKFDVYLPKSKRPK